MGMEMSAEVRQQCLLLSGCGFESVSIPRAPAAHVTPKLNPATENIQTEDHIWSHAYLLWEHVLQSSIAEAKACCCHSEGIEVQS